MGENGGFGLKKEKEAVATHHLIYPYPTHPPNPFILLLTTRVAFEVIGYSVTNMVQLRLIEVDIGLPLDEAVS